jgi:hypothetical protein
VRDVGRGAEEAEDAGRSVAEVARAVRRDRRDERQLTGLEDSRLLADGRLDGALEDEEPLLGTVGVLGQGAARLDDM